MTEGGWKSIDPAATAREYASPHTVMVGPPGLAAGLPGGKLHDPAIHMDPRIKSGGDEKRGAFDPFKIGQLNIGDVLISKDGPITLSRIVSQAADPATPLFNFRLSGNQTYFVRAKGSSGPFLLVHNK